MLLIRESANQDNIMLTAEHGYFSIPLYSHVLGDSNDDSEEESPLKKRARGPAKPSPQPPAPIIPPPPRCVPSSVTVALPPPVAPPSPTPPAVEQTPSSSQVYRPTWRGGRCGSDTMTCSGEQYLKRL